MLGLKPAEIRQCKECKDFPAHTRYLENINLRLRECARCRGCVDTRGDQAWYIVITNSGVMLSYAGKV